MLVDTHCHIHEALVSAILHTETRRRYQKAGLPRPDDIIKRAVQEGVTTMICVGTTLADSQLAVKFVQSRPNCWASIGIHPHEAKDHLKPADKKAFADLLLPSATLSRVDASSSVGGSRGVLSGNPSPSVLTSLRAPGVPQCLPPPDAVLRPTAIVAIGECGLDYYYTHSPKAEQVEILLFQLDLAQKHRLPVIFHVRDAFEDFWPILDQYQGIQGVIHSFSATRKELDQILARGLYVGLNGIMTFTKDADQLEAAKAVPLDRLLLETDAPFLTPYPHRGTICEPKHVRITAEFLAKLRGEALQDLAQSTTNNARKLFEITEHIYAPTI